MENPVPIQPAEDMIPPSNKKKYLGLSILAGFLYGVPTLLIGFVVSVFVLFFLISIFDGLKIHYTVLLGLAAFMGFVLAMAAGIISSRTVYQRSNEDGSPRQVGYAIISCAGIGLIGLLVFPVLCYGAYFLILRFLVILNLGDGQISSFLTGGGGESMMGVILIICIPAIAVIPAYIMAILSGAVAYRGLKRRKG